MSKINYLLSRFSLERLVFSINGLIALIIYTFFCKKNNSDIWVFGTGSGFFENNTQCFYDYCNRVHISEISLFFVTSHDDLKLPVATLKKGSILAYLKGFQAQTLIFDTGNSDIIPGYLRYARGIKVNLNHGQEGLKKLPEDYYRTKFVDIHCAVSDFERDIKVLECGASRESVFITGQPRYDLINLENKRSNNDVLFFFTWREGMQNISSEQLLETTYIEAIQQVFSSPEVLRILNDYNSTLYVKFHHMLPEMQFTCENQQIVFVDKSVDFTKLINECSILITDYSSVCWDYIYNSRPVIFYPFDYNDYSDSPGLYIDLINDDSMTTVTCTSELEIKLEMTMSKMSGNHKSDSIASQYFEYQDSENCKRVFDEIQKLLNNK
tara:strand:+ start:7191 stop:8336 length:1146 start_codon:yes stop_codon:yes gene_type:complete